MSEPAKDEAELAEVMAMAMAIHFSMNKMPHMSGNPLNRLGVMERRRLDDATHAAIAAIRAAGWAVVPVEPTKEMLHAGYDESGGRAVIGIWEAMLQTAPGVKP